MNYWILKTEPATFSFQKLMKEGHTFWDGVRNYQARNNLRAMEVGDRAYIYHSVSEKALVGVAEVTSKACPDPTATEGDWVGVDLKPIDLLKRPITLEEVKKHPVLKHIPLAKHSRLSVSPLSEEAVKIIEEIAQ